MKTCKNCGAEIEDLSKACRFCGAECGGTETTFQEQGTPETETYGDTGGASPADYPMKWHKFLMVMMIISGIITIINGISVLTGMQYMQAGGDASTVYRVFPGMRACDVTYGLMIIGVGVFSLIVRNQLNQFRRSGPGMMRIMYIMGIASSIIYLVWATAATNVKVADASSVGSIAGNAAMMIINSIYYSKRSALFVY